MIHYPPTVFMSTQDMYHQVQVLLAPQRPLPKRVTGKKAWKMRGKVPSRKYKR